MKKLPAIPTMSQKRAQAKWASKSKEEQEAAKQRRKDKNA